MARKKGAVGAQTAENIRQAGIDLIYRHGYEAMSMRQLAGEVDLQPSSLYNHFPNKQALLFAIMRDYMTDLIERAEPELTGAGERPEDRLRAFVAFHVRHHMTRHRDIRIVNLELRSLAPEHRAAVVALRDAYERKLDDILVAGREAGVFNVPDVRVTAFAVIAMLTGIAAWWRPEGRLSVDELVSIHQTLVLNSLVAK